MEYSVSLLHSDEGFAERLHIVHHRLTDYIGPFILIRPEPPGPLQENAQILCVT